MGYFYNWVFYRKGTKNDPSRGRLGPWKIKQPKALGQNTAAGVVAHLMDRLPDHGQGHIVYLDNLFTNIKLLKYGRERGWGATGTCTAKSGILKKFSQMKAEDAKKDEIPWGKLWVAATPDNLINMMAWKDNALVLSMSTASDALNRVKKLRKRPSETSSAAKTARVPFGTHARAWLEIPEYEDLYNLEMGAIDRGNQLKVTDKMEIVCRMGGQQSLVTWTEETALVNAYKLSFHSLVPKQEKWTDQTAFRTEVVENCFRIAKETGRKRKRVSTGTVVPDTTVPVEQHTIKRLKAQLDCVVCRKEGLSRAVRRKVLGELSVNMPGNFKGSGCRKGTIFSCKECNIALCKEGTCFARFYSLEWSN